PGMRVEKQVAVSVENVELNATEELILDVAVLENGVLKVVDAKFSEQNDLTQGKIFGYTESQKKAYRWISSGKTEWVVPHGPNAAKMGLNGVKVRVSSKVEIDVNSPEGIRARDFNDTI